jgi:hypothetical protein
MPQASYRQIYVHRLGHADSALLWNSPKSMQVKQKDAFPRRI